MAQDARRDAEQHLEREISEEEWADPGLRFAAALRELELAGLFLAPDLHLA